MFRFFFLSSVLVSCLANAGNVYRFKMPKNILEEGMPRSCAELQASDPSHGSGDVTIFPNGLRGAPIEVFCDMETDGGGWTRILSVGVGKKSCFGSFSLNAEGYCVKNDRVLGFNVDTIGIPFTEIRGGVSAYQSGSNDGFRRYTSGRSINDRYVDGISFTYFDYSDVRRHIFTYAIGQSTEGNRQSCPSVGGDYPPSFVGSDYYCESGNPEAGFTFDFYDEEILEGYQFRKGVIGTDVKALEVRVMNDQDTSDENIALNGIYVFIR